MATVVPVMKSLQTFQAAMSSLERQAALYDGLFKPQLEWQRRVQSFFAEVEERHRRLETAMRRWVADAAKLGALGWTIPVDSPVTFVTVLLSNVNERAIDRTFTTLYSEGRGARFAALFRKTLSRPAVRPWVRILREARYGYHRRKYHLTVPALLSVLEGVLAAQSQALTSRGQPRQLARQANRARKHVSAIWASIDAFVSVVFADRSFSSSRPPRLNRHWILHGRDAGPWTQADCLRLFLAIDTIAAAR